jgi:hypothetical protein
MSEHILPELAWWKETLSSGVKSSIRPFIPVAVLTTDASEFGAGATLEKEGRTTAFQLQWQTGESAKSSNAREMLGVLHSLHHFQLTGQDVLLRTDNTSVMHDVNRRTAATSLLPILLDILEYCHLSGVRVRAIHIPGVENVQADSLSRLYDSSDCRLSPLVFREICRQFQVVPSVDAFASQWNAQVPRYFALNKEQRAEGMNGLYQPWGKEACVYAFPPIPLISKVVRKAEAEGCALVLVTPSWPTIPVLHYLSERARKVLALPATEECVEIGQGMLVVGASLPPGHLQAWLL